MASILDKLPAGARTSTTGQGLATLVATGAAALATRWTQDKDVLTGVFALTFAAVLLVFPQQAASPSTSTAAPALAPDADLAAAAAVFRKKIDEGEAAKSALAAIAAPKAAAAPQA